MLSNFASSFAFFPERALNSFKIFTLSLVTSAIGPALIALNASLLEACIFLTFVPGIARHVLSLESLWPTSAISAISEIAYLAEQIRLSAASVDPRSIDFCEYVRAIGLLGFWIKNDSAAEV